MDSTLADLNRFERLTPFRVRDVLLIASQFDRYQLEESGYLAEIMNQEYTDLNLSQSPRIIHSTDAIDALDLVKKRSFDLIITMTKIGSLDPYTFAKKVKDEKSEITIVMLSQNTRELATLDTGNGIDRIFVWGGDSRILLSICKLIEDEKNVEHDVKYGDVQIILLVEDSRRFYSAYLPLLYTQLVEQTTRLMGEGGNLHEKLLRLRARAKILLATDMPQAKDIIDRYSRNIIGIFTDGRYPNPSGERDFAGLELIRYARRGDNYLPILLQSKNIELKEETEKLGVPFIHKEDSKLYNRIEEFMLKEMNFGDFIFRDGQRSEILKAANLEELVNGIDIVSSESIGYHAGRNDFSHWLRTRTEFSLASSIRPKRLDDFDEMEKVRLFLSSKIKEHIANRNRVTIRDVDDNSEMGRFHRIGRGSLGGKGKGLAFLFTRMADLKLGERFSNVEFVIPRCVVISTEIFGNFIRDNELSFLAHSNESDSEINRRFLEGEFRDDFILQISRFLETFNFPLAVRSSSLLEDSSHQPFAGVYSTFMLANDNPDFGIRMNRLLEAVKLVYASIFHEKSKKYVQSTANSIEDERMAVVIQQAVGRKTGNRFYPDVAGSARSRNHYPLDSIKSEDGLAAICLGLGRQVSEGGKCLRYSPGKPKKIHQFYSNKSILETSQSKFFAIELCQESGKVHESEEENLLSLPLNIAEEDGRLNLVGSTYIASDDKIVDSVFLQDGPRLVTFAPILKYGKFPLSEILHHVLSTCEEYIGSPVELEFAVTIEDSKISKFGILQMRPSMDESLDIDVDLDKINSEDSLCISSQSLGNGIIDEIYDIVYIHPDRLNRLKTHDIVPIISEIDYGLRKSDRPYILIGPGRWGSSDPSLGIPVEWSHIMGANCIIEVPMSDISVEPSQGTHFFQNIVSFNIGYLTITKDDFIDWEWLDRNEPKFENGPVRHLQVGRPVKVVLDSRDSEAIIVK